MRWCNHQITTGMLVYAGTGNLAATTLAWVGSTLPDLLEFPLGPLIRHRTLTHWPYPYLALFVGLWVWGGWSDNLLPQYGSYLLLGCLFHLLQDSLSPGGIPCGVTPFRGKIGLGWYRTFHVSEYVTALLLVLLGGSVAWGRGFFDAGYLVLEMQRLSLVLLCFGWSFR